MPLRLSHNLLDYVNEASIILSKVYEENNYINYYPKPTPEEIESWLKSDPEYDPLETAIAETSTGEVIGYAIAWVADDYEPGGGRVTIDPGIPEPLYTEALRLLLHWIGETLAYYDKAIDPATIYIGREYSRIHLAVENILGGRALYAHSGSLMEFRGSLGSTPPPGFREEVILNLPDISLVDEIRGVVNDAFSIYPGSGEWELTNAWNYYKLMFTEHPGEYFIVALLGEEGLAGLVEINHYEVLGGRRVGYVSLLATRREYQGRGIGSYLLSRAKEALEHMGIDTLVLDSVPKAQPLYEKLGFTPVLRNLKAHVPVTALLSL
ncbi:MAG: GNAT family N-acetyltransferase [Desulfurococcales archaeon]|nr:GNAT family N-acetyltransferase [Desulfurococcales archaeon]